MAKNSKVDSGTSSTTQSAKNLFALMDMAKDTEVGGGEAGDNETVKYTYTKNYKKVQIKLLLSSCKAPILISFYNGCWLINTKSLSSCQVRGI